MRNSTKVARELAKLVADHNDNQVSLTAAEFQEKVEKLIKASDVLSGEEIAEFARDFGTSLLRRLWGRDIGRNGSRARFT